MNIKVIKGLEADLIEYIAYEYITNLNITASITNELKQQDLFEIYLKDAFP